MALSESATQQIADHISQVTGEPFQVTSQRSVSGGCINQAMQLSDGERSFFIKLNQANQLAMFEAERDGLQEMIASQSIRVPRPLCCGTTGNTTASSAYIVMEWLDLGGRKGGNSWEKMGQQLATMHQYTSAQGYGWHRDNTIGETPQKNGWRDDWVEFWRDRRLGPQFSFAHTKGAYFPQRDELMNAIPRLLAGHTPTASLLHGDLWSGNAAITTAGDPIIFDPATYYGDPETDLAMTELFGRLPQAFYQAYNAVNPIDRGYEARKPLYNLYHILNHFNLFGGGYGDQANRMMAEILD